MEKNTRPTAIAGGRGSVLDAPVGNEEIVLPVLALSLYNVPLEETTNRAPVSES